MDLCHWWRYTVTLLIGVWSTLCLAQTTPPIQTTPRTKSTLAPTQQSERLKFRLAGYPRKHNEGRIEVFYKGEWGTICDDDFTLFNAHVLCRQLGFVSATGWTHSAKYGKGAGKIWLDNVQCSGSETSISVCKSRGWGNSDCTHDEDAGVICKDERLPGFVDTENVIEALSGQGDEYHIEEVRLRPVVATAKRRLPVTEGVVEVRYKNSWSQVCDRGWTPKNSRVICGLMGFPHERKVNKNFYRRLKRSAEAKGKVTVAASRQKLKSKANAKANANVKNSAITTNKRLYTERQKSHFLVHSVACLGTEVHLAACPLEFNKGNSSTGACEDGMPAVVSCVAGPLYTHNVALKKKLKVSKNVRLKGGTHTAEGRVEVMRGGKWGTVCDDRWNLQSASVVCRELGFGSAKEALTGARMGQGVGPIHMNEVQCTGQERSIWSCHYKNITEEDCMHTEDASVRCNTPYMGYEKTVRLQGGRSSYEGRVEVRVGERWGALCSQGWSTREAMVACRQLGLGYSMHAITETWYWDSSNVTDMVWSGVKCTGSEMSLTQCQRHKVFNCQKAVARFSAGVICSETASDLVLNATLVQQSVYIEDRPLHMLYCAAEEDCLSKTAAQANWPYGHRRLLRFSSQIHNVGRADFRPKLGRHSWVWHACHGHYHSMDIFTHYDILSVNGTKMAEGHKASFCLEDSECQEGISKRYECANFGEQGITVGCWDLYRHDIDCQWIDITDVKPGNYILQVVINPNQEVSEMDYTNNAMKCSCKYDGHRIWVHNCHIGDAFSDEVERKFEKYPGQFNNQIMN
ncbi:lysyl oxidase homolog 3B isoform X2 [Alosa sapidissima]|uniref:lysyl oxidase homolog 3B isoform X2 n=1 Tax=Alosa sapidissima TaxID=34773 RepID=UPI001C09202C|nr:lysyl oxidase homolog 3B isoform X2 [Alosa sapidissima]